VRRISILLPDGLHDEVMNEARERGVTASDVIRDALYERDRSRQQRLTVENDPLLAIAGSISDGTLNRDLDEELYGI